MRQKFSTRLVLVLLSCGVFALVISLAPPHHGHAQDISRFDPHFPFGSTDVQGSPKLGVAPGQTLRWNAVNVDQANTCQAELSILDTAGNPVVPPKSITLAPGTSAFIDYRAVPPSSFIDDRAVPPSSGRSQVRTLIRLQDSTECVLLLSSEVFDSVTSRTQYVVIADPVW